MQSNLSIIGHGHALGNRVQSNEEIALGLGLERDWFMKATGIANRRLCGPDQTVLTLGLEAITAALRDAELDIESLESEAVLLHIQNGLTHFTPPPAILLAARLGSRKLRSLSIDGVCSEPINLIEIGSLMLDAGCCSTVIVSASVDFLSVVDDRDSDTVGLFGAGAGAIVLQKGRNPDRMSGLRGLCWESRPEYWDLGVVTLDSFEKLEASVNLRLGYYRMQGKQLARAALTVIPGVIDRTLEQAGWHRDELDLIITHQPNAKLLEIGIRQLKLDPRRVFCPVANIGNLGPASLLSSFSMAKGENRIRKGDKLLFLSFGLGFSCGAAAFLY